MVAVYLVALHLFMHKELLLFLVDVYPNVLEEDLEMIQLELV